MKRITMVAFGLLLCALAVSCVSTTKMTGSWIDPTYQSAPVTKVLVIGMGENETYVRAFESAMAQEMKKRKITAVLGSSIIPVGTPIDTTGGRKYCAENGIELVSVTRLLGLSKETEYVPPTTYYTPGPTYRFFYPYYYTSYSVATTPGYIRDYRVATLETNVYSLKDERLVWSGQSRTVDPASALDVADDFAAIFVQDMAISGVFGKK